MTSSPKAPADIYAERSARFEALAERIGARSRLVSNLRGLSFGLMVVSAIVALTGRAPTVTWSLAGLGGLAFAWLVALHARVIAAEDDARRFARVNRDARARCSGAWRDLPQDGARFADAAHPYSGDLDLFGRGSLFQRLCTAHTRFGQEALARFLCAPAEVETVTARQAAVRALGVELELRQKLESLALAVVEPTGAKNGKGQPQKMAPDPEPLLAWAEGAPELSSRAGLVWAARLLPLFTIAGIAGNAALGWPAASWGLPLIAQIGINLATRRVAWRVFTAVSSTEGAFLRYGAMLEILEGLEIDSPLLRRMRERLRAGGELPSRAMHEFRRGVSWFDLRHNGLVHPFANALLLWDVHCVVLLEKWRSRAGKAARDWFRVLGELEALCSLAALAHDEPGFAFPEVSSDAASFTAEGLAHPLIDADKRVANDVSLSEPGRGLLVTGSNMSGKSTMLRSMGLAAVMAFAGGPVCARRLVLARMAVRTSMRISDSLEGGVSHFYAEVRKLKGVVDATRAELPVLFLLDEILHGTNSRERQIGARWVMTELLTKGATGAVSTHDMGLCQLPEPLMSRVDQVHFQESVKDGAMTFDYRLRTGPVTAGNALRLMKLVGLDVPVE